VLRLHDTATGTVRPLDLREPGKASVYVCGVTVSDVPHVGHGRFSLVWDVLRRYLEWSGLEVRYVSNITDVDDKIIARAARDGRPAAEVAAEFEASWYDTMDRLGVRRPDDDPHATAYIDGMVALVGRLVDRGIAYETDDGVYLSVAEVPGYGLLARQDLESLRSGARIEVDEAKRSPLDFAVWKKAKPGEPSWPSPWGEGRPGWHTECVVMSLDLLGDGFELHGGGLDLAFPHHENERAQAVALEHEFARHWVHNGLVVAPGGEKMGKSLGNAESLAALLRTYDPRAYRLLVLRSHYRSPLVVTGAEMADASPPCAAWTPCSAGPPRRASSRGPRPRGARPLPRPHGQRPQHPPAMGLLFEQVRLANTVLDTEDDDSAATAARHDRALATAVGLDVGDRSSGPDERALAIAGRRDEARAARDWPAADAARDELVGLGYVVEDGPAGTRIRQPAEAACDRAAEAPAIRRRAACDLTDAVGRGFPEPMRRGARAPLPAGFATIWTTVALDLVGFGIVLPILPLYARELDASPTAIGALVASFSLMQLVFSPIWGRVSDRVGRKPVLVLSLVGTAVGSLLTGLAGSLWLLFAGRLLDGISGASVSVAQAAVADVAPPEQRARLLGLLGAAFGVGFVIGPALGSLAAVGGPRLPFLLAAAVAAVNAVVALRRLPETHPDPAVGGRRAAHGPGRGPTPTGATGAGTDVAGEPLPVDGTADALQPPVSSGLLRFAVVAFTSLVAFSAFEATFSLLGRSASTSPSAARAPCSPPSASCWWSCRPGSSTRSSPAWARCRRCGSASRSTSSVSASSP
jgi:cysteinyl-tRNA synthetase